MPDHLKGMDRDLFPAPAGINRYGYASEKDAEAVPRTCGDKPIQIERFGLSDDCSPHLRG